MLRRDIDLYFWSGVAIGCGIMMVAILVCCAILSEDML